MYGTILFFVLSYKTASALIYNDKCTKSCELPGLVCVSGQCKCDSKGRLFWTGARCTQCANDWTMTETACITVYETRAAWQLAKATCKRVNADLISLRSRDMIPHIYNVTNRGPLAAEKHLRFWTSAHVVNLNGVETYQWTDRNLDPFNDRSDWWCRPIQNVSGVSYQHQEPTKDDGQGTREDCISLWRAKTNVLIVCLDDRVCAETFPFICEISESTAVEYLGPAPISNNTGQTSNNNGIGTVTSNQTMRPPKMKSASKTLAIVMIVIVVLVLLGLLSCGAILWLRRRRVHVVLDTATQPRPTIVSEDRKTVDESVINAAPILESIPVKEQKNKRAGHSRQQFDEFD